MKTGTDLRKLLKSNHALDIGTRNAVFAGQFKDRAGWSQFTRQHLHNGSVSDQLKAPAHNWTPQSFQALFVAAWAHHPVEKGSYMIDLSKLSKEELAEVAQAHQKHCSSRPSSHLSGAGRSASKGFNFLNGYKELLVQMEHVEDKPYLFLKAEGHTTGINGIVGHTNSYFHKVKTGEGLTASPFLNALANANPTTVEARAAENYGKPYGKLLKALQLDAGSKTVTTREMSKALFEATGFEPEGLPAGDFLRTATNERLGKALINYCDSADSPLCSPALRANDKIGSDMLKELREVAESLVADGDTRHGRVFREVISSPAALDASMAHLQA